MSERMNATPSPLRRLGIVMEPDLADPHEAAGVLNPAVARGPHGRLYLLPRLVAPGNYSRIGLARVLCDPCGTPTGVERRGVVLTPQAPYERNTQSGGGVEDPRVTYLAACSAFALMRFPAAALGDRRGWRQPSPSSRSARLPWCRLPRPHREGSSGCYEADWLIADGWRLLCYSEDGVS